MIWLIELSVIGFFGAMLTASIIGAYQAYNDRRLYAMGFNYLAAIGWFYFTALATMIAVGDRLLGWWPWG